MTPTDLRFAFKTSPQNTTWPAILDVWRTADEIELFESGWTSDHFYPTHSAERAVPRLEGWITLTALAQATKRLRFGTLVTGIHYRHPAVLANMAATLDVVSGGRLELGIGTGWNEEESDAYGIELGTPAQRSDRFEEACHVLTDLLTRETTTFHGKYYNLTEARCDPKPVQRPHPPICIGGSGEKRTLPTAARYAQHWNFDTGTIAQFTRARDVLHHHCERIGRDPRSIRVSCQVPHRGDSAATAASAAAFREAGAELAIIYLTQPYDAAVLEPLAEALSEVNGSGTAASPTSS